MNFKASLDRTTKIITVALIIVMLAIPLSIFLTLEESESYGVLVVPILMLVVLGVIVEYRITAYKVTSDGIIICRPAENVVIKSGEVSKVELLSREKLKRSIRTFGVGGFFGYFGSFYNKQLGAMTWYLTRRDRLVLIETNSGKKIVLSPDEPEKFVAAAQLT